MVDSTVFDDVRTEADVRTGASARAARHWFLVLAPVFTGAFAIAGAVADPAADQDGAPLYRAYAADPDRLQFKSLAYHFAWALLGVSALLLAGQVRRRGSWPATLAGLLAFLGMTSMPGFLIADFYDSAIGQLFGVEGDLAVQDRMGGMWALVVLAFSGMVALLLALPLATLAAWRAGLVRWWTPAAVTAGLAGMLVVGVNVPGTIVALAGLAVLTVDLAREPRRAVPHAVPSTS